MCTERVQNARTLDSDPSRSIAIAPYCGWRRSIAMIGAVAAILCLLTMGCDESSEPLLLDGDVGGSQPDTEQAVDDADVGGLDTAHEPDSGSDTSPPDAAQGEDADVVADEPDVSPQPTVIVELRYEKIIHHVEGPNNRVEVVWSEGEGLTISRPVFMTHSGTHEIDLSFNLAEEWELSDAFHQLPESSEELAQRIRQRMVEDRLLISDPDTTVLELVTDDPSHQSVRIEAQGVEFWSDTYDRDTELEAMAILERQIWDLMNTELDAGQGQ